MTSEIVLPGTGTVEYDEAHTYRRTARFDHAGRPRATTLPRDPDEPGTERERAIGGLLVYNRRGLPAQAAAFLGCEPGELGSVAAARTDCESQGGALQTIVHAIEYLRDGLVGSLAYGDDAGGRRRTVSETVYDVRRRPVRMRTRRQRDAGAMAPEDLGAVGVVVDQELVWDGASNLVAQIDHRDPGEWPAGYRPQTVHVRHDALYRVVGAEFDYTQPDGRRTPSDVGTDWRSDFAATRSVDPMRQRPAPMAPSAAPERVASLTWEWDYLANTTEWTDDASRFYERSLGDIVNGDDASDALRPSALYLASNIGDGTGLADGGGGWVEVDYGRGGNAVAMTVHAQCRARTTGPLSARVCRDPGGTDLERRRGELGRCACASEQHYEYRWDELNRLAEARRYDREASGVWRRAVRQRYRYDASNQRTVKQTLDEEAGDEPPRPGADPRERIALYVYPGDFERRGLVRGELEYEASPELGTETQYLVAGARTVWRRGEPDAGYERDHRLTVAIGDLIQTTAAVLDVRTGALLEASTYYPNGARETFRVDGSTLTAPEVAGFTGKEGDEEVGLVYFGERYLIPRLGRWASPDPLHVHSARGGEALNAYHYVDGSLLQSADPLGLCREGEECRTKSLTHAQNLEATFNAMGPILGNVARLFAWPGAMAAARARDSADAIRRATPPNQRGAGTAVLQTGAAIGWTAVGATAQVAQAVAIAETAGAIFPGTAGAVPQPRSSTRASAPTAEMPPTPREATSVRTSGEPSAPIPRGARTAGRVDSAPLDASRAGGAVRSLRAEQIRITERGIEVVEEHLARFGADRGNQVMLDRLRRIAKGELEATPQDRNFYAHELRESVRFRQAGIPEGEPAPTYEQYQQCHRAPCADYGIEGRRDELYTPEARAEIEASERSAAAAARRASQTLE